MAEFNASALDKHEEHQVNELIKTACESKQRVMTEFAQTGFIPPELQDHKRSCRNCHAVFEGINNILAEGLYNNLEL